MRRRLTLGMLAGTLLTVQPIVGEAKGPYASLMEEPSASEYVTYRQNASGLAIMGPKEPFIWVKGVPFDPTVLLKDLRAQYKNQTLTKKLEILRSTVNPDVLGLYRVIVKVTAPNGEVLTAERPVVVTIGPAPYMGR